MELMDDSHLSEEVLTRYAFHGIPESAPDVTNHLVACDTCHDFYEEQLNLKAALKAQGGAGTGSPRSQSGFSRPKPAWAAAAALFVLIFSSPDVQRQPGGMQTVNVAAVRGSQAVHARPNTPLVLRLDAMGVDLPSVVQVDVVNDRGRSVWQGSAQQVDSAWQAQTDTGLGRGRYWIRIPDPAHPGELLREFALEVQ